MQSVAADHHVELVMDVQPFTFGLVVGIYVRSITSSLVCPAIQNFVVPDAGGDGVGRIGGRVDVGAFNRVGLDGRCVSAVVGIDWGDCQVAEWWRERLHIYGHW